MSDGFTPTSTPPTKNPILAKTRKAESVVNKETVTVYEPYSSPMFSQQLPEKALAVEDIGTPPADMMTEVDTLEGLYTDATYDEIDAGKRANEAFAKRRKAELDYGKNFTARRKATANG